MAKFFKSGRIVVVLNGKYAGRKAVIIRSFEDGHKDRKFGHALIAGIDRYPRKMVKALGRHKQSLRMRVKPFVKYINLNHVMPTRYSLDSTVSTLLNTKISDEAFTADAEATAKKTTINEVRKVLQDRYKKLGEAKAAADKHTTGVMYFFRKLRF